jgi:hypothetical protein
MASRANGQGNTRLMKCCGEMWARNAKNIKDVPARTKGGQGVYILYDGSTPVYVGKGNIQSRLRNANKKGKRRGNAWDYFSWYILKDQGLIHDVEVLLLRILPPYLRYMTRQGGKFKGIHLTSQKSTDNTPIYIKRKWLR